jgi:hypothetical protein
MLPFPAQVLVTALSTVISTAHAGQPLVADDASLVTPATCQVETWVHPAKDGRECWMQPASNSTGNVEFGGTNRGAAGNRWDFDRS